MKIRSAITILVAIAWMSTQIAMGLAHGMTSHDHLGTTHQSTSSHEAKHSLDVEQTDVADQNLHSHMQKILDQSSDSSVMPCCDTTCSALLINGLMTCGIDKANISGGFTAVMKQGFVELPTPPPNHLL